MITNNYEMDITDKRKDIITALQSTSDELLIEEVYELLNPEKSIEEIDIDGLPDVLQKKLESAMDDYRNCRYISHNEMKQKMQQWLTK